MFTQSSRHYVMRMNFFLKTAFQRNANQMSSTSFFHRLTSVLLSVLIVVSLHGGFVIVDQFASNSATITHSVPGVVRLFVRSLDCEMTEVVALQNSTHALSSQSAIDDSRRNDYQSQNEADLDYVPRRRLFTVLTSSSSNSTSTIAKRRR